MTGYIHTSVENVAEDEIGGFVVERWDSRQELVETHAQAPPVYS